jgi:carboxyl-terminal processing protease
MNENGFPSENKPRSGISFSWVWVVSTVILCAAFVFASVPQALAQQDPGASTALGQAESAQKNRRNADTILQVLNFVQRNYVEEVDSQALFEGAMTGLFNALQDPHSSFLPESEMRSMNNTTQGSFGGVGLFISKPARPDGSPAFIEVASPIEGTPGWRAGINPGDLIISIDGEPTDVLSTEEVVSRLQGLPGLPVTLVIRRGERLEFPVTLTRAIIEVPTVRHAMIGDIGYVRILTFTPNTTDRVAEAIASFKENNFQSIIIDLRNNYGGLLDAAVGVSSLFLDGGVVVRIKPRNPADNNTLMTNRKAMVGPDVPIIVLINRGSASASEIVAGALKDRGRAILVGERSFGKGSVQQVFPLGNAGFKITTAHYYTPNSVSIDKIGIYPDRMVTFPDFTDADAEKLNRLINDNKIPPFVSENPNATTAQIDAFVRSLEREYGLDSTLIRRLIRNEQNRTVIAPEYDLEYDVQLKEAVNILNSGNFRELLESARSLQELQDQALEESAQAS